MASSALPAVRDALSVPALLLDRSDELFDDARRLVARLEARCDRSFDAAGELRALASDGSAGQAALAALRGAALPQALADARAAAAGLADLQSNRQLVRASRNEALEEKAAAMEASREALSASVSEQMKEANRALLRRLREIVAGGTGADAAPAAPASPVAAAAGEPGTAAEGQAASPHV